MWPNDVRQTRRSIVVRPNTEANYHTKLTQNDALSRIMSNTQQTRPKSESGTEKQASAAQKRPTHNA